MRATLPVTPDTTLRAEVRPDEARVEFETPRVDHLMVREEDGFVSGVTLTAEDPRILRALLLDAVLALTDHIDGGIESLFEDPEDWDTEPIDPPVQTQGAEVLPLFA